MESCIEVMQLSMLILYDTMMDINSTSSGSNLYKGKLIKQITIFLLFFSKLAATILIQVFFQVIIVSIKANNHTNVRIPLM